MMNNNIQRHIGRCVWRMMSADWIAWGYTGHWTLYMSIVLYLSRYHIWCVFHIFIFGGITILCKRRKSESKLHIMSKWVELCIFCKSCRYPSLYEIESSGWERVQEPGCGHAAAYSIARLCLCLAQHNTHKYFLLHVQIFSDCTYQYFLLGRGYVQSRYYKDNR